MKWERVEVEWGVNGESMEVQEMVMHEIFVPKRARFGIWGRPLRVTTP